MVRRRADVSRHRHTTHRGVEPRTRRQGPRQACLLLTRVRRPPRLGLQGGEEISEAEIRTLTLTLTLPLRCGLVRGRPGGFRC